MATHACSNFRAVLSRHGQESGHDVPGTSRVTELALRAEIIATAVQMNERRIHCGKSGNVSARTGTGFLITPTGIPYESMRPETLSP